MKKRKRHPLTRIEISRDGRKIFRVAITADVIEGCHAELGALIRKISPGAGSTATAPPASVSEEILVRPEHSPDDAAYHDQARHALHDLFGALCDPLLADAIELAEGERARRITTGGN